MGACFLPADILLPRAGTDLSKWAVVACDQFTSRPDYWETVRNLTEGAPTTLDLIYPEAWLSRGDAYIPEIQSAMERYLQEGILTQTVTDGFVLVRRVTESGERLGLVGRLDLEQYDYRPGARAAVRATEGTILSRIPPRVKIRRGAPIESPHIMMLLDDAKRQLIEPLAEEALPLLYDTELMQGGGHLSGYAVTGEAAARTAALIERMQKAAPGGFFLAAGDGNHSLATAKACWEELKPSLEPEQRKNPPARYALVELVNLHSPALLFQPIHRVVFGAELDALVRDFDAALAGLGMALIPGGEVVFAAKGEKLGFDIAGLGERLPLDVLQRFLDEWLQRHAEATVDYVHDEQETVSHASDGKAVGILLQGIPKDGFFAAIRAGGVLPRKTFSMGEGHEKRYYMECRRIL